MASCREPVNHPFVVWTACFLWLISMVTIMVSLLLFLSIILSTELRTTVAGEDDLSSEAIINAGDILACTGTKEINAFALLSGVVMLPTNLQLVYLIALDRQICPKTKVGFCPLWLCIGLIVVINGAGTALCVNRMLKGEKLIQMNILHGMAGYRTSHNHKRFIDNLQWALKCCGLNSYKDWFVRDWYDKSRDYEWQPTVLRPYFKSLELTDSVPLSCCKSGSCISNYLTELGTMSINTKGCKNFVNRLIKSFVIVHIVIFVLVILMEAMVFLSVVNWVRSRGPDEFWRKRRVFRLAAHYIGRRRNCYSIAVRNVHRALVYATKARKLKKQDMKALWDTRITAACEQHNISYFTLKEGLDRASIMLDRKSLSDLASWEPKTFESLAAVAKQKLHCDGFLDGSDKRHPTGVNLNLKDVMLDAWLKEKKK